MLVGRILQNVFYVLCYVKTFKVLNIVFDPKKKKYFFLSLFQCLRISNHKFLTG